MFSYINVYIVISMYICIYIHMFVCLSPSRRASLPQSYVIYVKHVLYAGGVLHATRVLHVVCVGDMQCMQLGGWSALRRQFGPAHASTPPELECISGQRRRFLIICSTERRCAAIMVWRSIAARARGAPERRSFFKFIYFYNLHYETLSG